MALTMKMTYSSTVLTTVVLIHAIVVVLHGLAHQIVPVPLSLSQSLFVGIVVVLNPIVAAVLLWTPLEQIGRWLFLGSMTGALLFGIYNHFVVISPDHISQVPSENWGITFQITAFLLLLTEGIGSGVGIWAVNSIKQKAL
jgi:hypothetical protein